MKNLVEQAKLLIALIPGSGLLAVGLGVPPNNTALFSAVSESLGVLSLVILLAISSQIRALPWSKVATYSLIAGAAFLCSVVVYVLLHEKAVVVHNTRGTAYFPLVLEGQILHMVEKAGSRVAAIERYGLDAVLDAIDKGNAGVLPSLGFTTSVLLLSYGCTFVLLTVAFGITLAKQSGGKTSK